MPTPPFLHELPPCLLKGGKNRQISYPWISIASFHKGILILDYLSQVYHEIQKKARKFAKTVDLI
jgi:hypothetical protein